ncbi:MAG: hypothetical protein ACRD5L_09855, partial [Bryobacteraceae bacterium]
LLLLLAGFLPAMAGLLKYFEPSRALVEGLFLPCPVYTLVLAFDASYKLDSAQFWSSAAFIQAMSWLLVALACQIAPRSWQDKAAVPARKQPRNEEGGGSPASAFRKQLLDQNAYYWLAARPWWKAHAVWAVIAMAVFWLVSMIFSVGWLDEAVCMVVALTLNGTFKLWITLEAARSLAEDVRSGAFELLLATPLSTPDIVRGQFLALRRQFLGPLAAVAGIELFFMVKLMATLPRGQAYFFCMWMAMILMLAADLVTLSVVAMEAALTQKNLTRALLKTVRWVLALPWALWAGVAAVRQAWVFVFPDTGSPVSWRFNLGCWLVIGLVLDFLLCWAAWRRLTGHFRELALRQFSSAPPPAGFWATCAKLGRAARDNVWRRPARRKWAVGVAALLVA